MQDNKKVTQMTFHIFACKWQFSAIWFTSLNKQCSKYSNTHKMCLLQFFHVYIADYSHRSYFSKFNAILSEKFWHQLVATNNWKYTFISTTFCCKLHSLTFGQ